MKKVCPTFRCPRWTPAAAGSSRQRSVGSFINPPQADIVEHGRTGFLVRDESEMVDAIKAVRSLDPEDCRQAAREQFSADRMVKRYLETYAQILQRSEYANTSASARQFAYA